MATPQPQAVLTVQPQEHWAADWDGSSAPSLLNTLPTKALQSCVPSETHNPAKLVPMTPVPLGNAMQGCCHACRVQQNKVFVPDCPPPGNKIFSLKLDHKNKPKETEHLCVPFLIEIQAACRTEVAWNHQTIGPGDLGTVAGS